MHAVLAVVLKATAVIQEPISAVHRGVVSWVDALMVLPPWVPVLKDFALLDGVVTRTISAAHTITLLENICIRAFIQQHKEEILFERNAENHKQPTKRLTDISG